MASAATLALGIAAFSAVSADAHVPKVTDSCSTLSVSLTLYNARYTNSVTVTIDGQEVASDSNFGTHFVHDYSFSDRTTSHTWRVDYAAGDYPNGDYGYTGFKEGKSTPCQVKDASAQISFSPPICNTVQTLVLGPTENATWGAVTYSGTDNLDFTVTATAVGNHRFADGDVGSNGTTKSFSGTLIVDTTTCPASPCLTDSAVSYTYDATINSGVIKVEGTAGQTLCNPFWVTAASWTFDGNTMWPQTLDKWVPANSGNQIDHVGSYAYGAEVGCGQGDIYATFTAPGVPYPTAGVLTAPGIPYHELFLHGMGFSGTPGNTFMNRDPSACHVTVVETPEVVFTDVCGISGDTIAGNVDTDEVDFTTTDNRINGVGAVTVTATPKDHFVFAKNTVTTWSHDFTNEPCPVVVTEVPPPSFTDVCGTANDGLSVPANTATYTYTETWNLAHTSVVVTVVAIGSNTFADGVTTSWSHNFTNEPCLTKIKLIEPSAFDPTCPEEIDAESGYIMLDLQTGLHYSIDGVATSQAKNPEEPGTYTISVTVDPNYTLVGPTSWELVVAVPTGCLPTYALLSTTASMADLTCDSGGSYTLANTEGVAWFVNGSTTATAAGTYKVTDASVVKVEAKIIDPVADGWEADSQTSWTFNFKKTGTCELTTLAFTGSTGRTGGLLLSGILLMIGGAVVALERRLRKTAK